MGTAQHLNTTKTSHIEIQLKIVIQVCEEHLPLA